ncbi:hypothetical protein SBA5_330036 [Candidatus Sulfotelmatomonas gaucii]|uniref:Uncharacterized protein n=1 Tax=Candidatus Sulfuritelmatomonas gaucii TaxID=2043161 RepID=A0A2N9LFX0_9BACT|nr:hypothetical protein SBA5_330036 [Candidatus Sulfotelmatomonas gaucii]
MSGLRKGARPESAAPRPTITHMEQSESELLRPCLHVERADVTGDVTAHTPTKSGIRNSIANPALWDQIKRRATPISPRPQTQQTGFSQDGAQGFRMRRALHALKYDGRFNRHDFFFEAPLPHRCVFAFLSWNGTGRSTRTGPAWETGFATRLQSARRVPRHHRPA